MNLKLHSRLESSYANGPGKRAVIWFQGCTLNCKGCYNPFTHSPHSGSIFSVEEILQWLLSISGDLEGVTISGGEPCQQLSGLIELVTQIRVKTNLSCIVFSGYTLNELLVIPRFEELVPNIDVLIAGRFIEPLRCAHHLFGSSNKTLHFFSKKYSKKDFLLVPTTEIIIDQEGNLINTGIDPL